MSELDAHSARALHVLKSILGRDLSFWPVSQDRYLATGLGRGSERSTRRNGRLGIASSLVYSTGI